MPFSMPRLSHMQLESLIQEKASKSLEMETATSGWLPYGYQNQNLKAIVSIILVDNGFIL